jgi:hypothetical protein
MIWKAPSGVGRSFYTDNLLANEGKMMDVNLKDIDAFLTNHARMIDKQNNDAIELSNEFFTIKTPPALYKLSSHLANQPINPNKGINEIDAYIRDYRVPVAQRLNTLAFYFNDQRAKLNEPSRYVKVEQPKIEAQWSGFSWKFAHSKFMLSIDVQDDVRYFKGTGFLMQHSMPNTPFEAVNAWKKEKQNFIPNENDHNVNVKSQHMFCFSIATPDVMLNVINGLKLSRPQFVHSNVDRMFLDGSTPALDIIHDLLSSDYGVDLAKVCRAQWVNNRQRNYWTNVMNYIPADCIKTVDLGNNMIMFAHSTLPHSKRMPDDDEEVEADQENYDANVNMNINSNKRKAQKVEEDYDEDVLDFNDDTAKEMELEDLTALADYAVRKYQKKTTKANTQWRASRHNVDEAKQRKACIQQINAAKKELHKELEYSKNVHSTYFGPVHWDEVARKLGVPLLVSCWKNTNLPSIFNVILVSKFLDTEHGQRHDKIAVAAVGPDQANMHWSCFGDANHRTSEISHAGITICIKNSVLWKKLRDGVQSVYNYPFSLKRDFPEQVDLIKLLGFKKEQIVRATSAQDYLWRIKPDGQEPEPIQNNNNNNT